MLGITSFYELFFANLFGENIYGLFDRVLQW